MRTVKLQIPRNFLISGVILLVLIGVLTTYAPTKDTATQNTEKEIQAKFALLSSKKSNVCAGPDALLSQTTDRIQGSCCNPMNLHRYQEQLAGLKQYAHITKIPADPYDIPATLTKELLDYQQTIQLTHEQQKIYDQAVKISHEGGPCCCKCWRWYAFEGLAKYLITKHNFSAEQIADVWDLEDGCGGAGHEHSNPDGNGDSAHTEHT